MRRCRLAGSAVLPGCFIPALAFPHPPKRHEEREDELLGVECGSEAIWNVLGTVRQVIEENLPPGLLTPADETEPTVAAELEAITAALHRLGAVLPAGIIAHEDEA